MTPTKRDSPSSIGSEEEASKRIKVSEDRDTIIDTHPVSIPEPYSALVSSVTTQHGHARRNIQRSIAAILSQDGFDAATPEAMESFTGVVEEYIGSIIKDVKALALASRRDNPLPSDFEAVLRRYNLPISSLQPHLNTNISLPQPPIQDIDEMIMPSVELATLPLLGHELSGAADKGAKSYVPSSFPEFPSQHTYRFTSQADNNTRDSQKVREAAAINAQQGEEALRQLVRASKMRKQKQVKSLVQQDNQGKERFRLWESTMTRFMANSNGVAAMGQVDIADHSMIVNGDTSYSRKDISRMGKRTSALKESNNR